MRAFLMSATATVVSLAGFFDEAEPQFTAAIELARELGDDRTLGRVEWGRTISYWSHGRMTDAITTGRASVEHLRRADDAWTLVDALGWTSFPLLFSGRLDEARRLAQEAADLGAKLGHVAGETLARRAVTMADFFAAPRPRGPRTPRARGSRSAREHRLTVGLAVARVARQRPAAPGRPRRVGRCAPRRRSSSSPSRLGPASAGRNCSSLTRSPATTRRVRRCWPRRATGSRDRETPGRWAATSRSTRACRVR